MSKAPRLSLTSLADRMAKKPVALVPPPADAVVPTTEPKAPAKDSRVQVMARMTPAERKALRRIALNQDTTVQALIEEAIRDVIRRHEGL